MAVETDLISWKTDAWKNPNMVSWYHQRMIDDKGTNRLKNTVETNLCQRYAVGSELLDVGIGTGRGSLPLLREGYRVTGIDSSQAMLDMCRQLAAPHAIDLRQGDLAKLPFEDARFDTLLSLNVMVHFPHWQQILAEWSRVLRPGGRLIFDVHSLDHVEQVSRVRGVPVDRLLEGELSGGPSQFLQRLRVNELVAEAGRLGLSVRAIVPYAGVFGAGNVNFWLKGSRADGRAWERLLSWTAVDEQLFDFALFLEESLFAHLSSIVTGRFMVVLEKTPQPEHNAAWLARNEAINRMLGGELTAQALAAFLPDDLERWRQRLQAMLDYRPNLVLLFHLYSACMDAPHWLALRDLLTPAQCDEIERWATSARIDRAAYALVSSWHQEPQCASTLMHRGVPLGPGLEYQLMRDVLEQAFNLFSVR
ncbi:MAG: class I SAM-dependent methyltransferase [Pseudomonadota bacterium]